MCPTSSKPEEVRGQKGEGEGDRPRRHPAFEQAMALARARSLRQQAQQEGVAPSSSGLISNRPVMQEVHPLNQSRLTNRRILHDGVGDDEDDKVPWHRTQPETQTKNRAATTCSAMTMTAPTSPAPVSRPERRQQQQQKQSRPLSSFRLSTSKSSHARPSPSVVPSARAQVVRETLATSSSSSTSSSPSPDAQDRRSLSPMSPLPLPSVQPAKESTRTTPLLASIDPEGLDWMEAHMMKQRLQMPNRPTAGPAKSGTNARTSSFHAAEQAVRPPSPTLAKTPADPEQVDWIEASLARHQRGVQPTTPRQASSAAKPSPLDDSFHSLVSTDGEKEEVEVLLPPSSAPQVGDLVEDIAADQRMTSGGPCFSVKQARGWIELLFVQSSDLPAGKRLQILERLHDMELNTNLPRRLIQGSNSSSTHRSCLVPMCRRLLDDYLRPAAPPAAAESLRLGLSFTAKCLQVAMPGTDYDAPARCLFRDFCAYAPDTFSRLLLLCDTSQHRRSIPNGVLQAMTAYATSSNANLVGRLSASRQPKDLAVRDFEQCLKFPCRLPEKSRLFGDFMTSLYSEVSLFDIDTANNFENIWVEKFPDELELLETEDGESLFSAPVTVHALFSNGHALLEINRPNQSSRSTRLKEISRTLASSTDFTQRVPGHDDDDDSGGEILVTVPFATGDVDDESVEFARGLLLQSRADDARADVYLLDFGRVISVETSRQLAMMPAQVKAEPPLMRLAKIQGLAGLTDLSLVRYCTKLLYYLIPTHENCLKLLECLGGVDRVHRFLIDLFDSGHKYSQWLALRLAHAHYKGRSKVNDRNISDASLVVCRCLSDFLYKRVASAFGGGGDGHVREAARNALYALFYNMSQMPSRRSVCVFDVAQLDVTLERVKEVLQGADAEDNDADARKGLEDLLRVTENLALIPKRGRVPLQERCHKILPYQLRNGEYDKRMEEERQHRQRGRPQQQQQQKRHTDSLANRRPSARQNHEGPWAGGRDFYNAYTRSINELTPEQLGDVRGEGGGVDARAVQQQQQSKVSQRNFHDFDEIEQPDDVDLPELEKGLLLNPANKSSVAFVPASRLGDIGGCRGQSKGNRRAFDELSKHVNAFVNSGQGGLVFVGVETTGLIEGIRLDRGERDMCLQVLDNLTDPGLMSPELLVDMLDLRFLKVAEPLGKDSSAGELVVIEISVKLLGSVKRVYKFDRGTHRGKAFVRCKGKSVEMTANQVMQRAAEEAAAREQSRGNSRLRPANM